MHKGTSVVKLLENRRLFAEILHYFAENPTWSGYEPENPGGLSVSHDSTWPILNDGTSWTPSVVSTTRFSDVPDVGHSITAGVSIFKTFTGPVDQEPDDIDQLILRLLDTSTGSTVAQDTLSFDGTNDVSYFGLNVHLPGNYTGGDFVLPDAFDLQVSVAEFEANEHWGVHDFGVGAHVPGVVINQSSNSITEGGAAVTYTVSRAGGEAAPKAGNLRVYIDINEAKDIPNGRDVATEDASADFTVTGVSTDTNGNRYVVIPHGEWSVTFTVTARVDGSILHEPTETIFVQLDEDHDDVHTPNAPGVYSPVSSILELDILANNT
jgi:hypothetical protein